MYYEHWPLYRTRKRLLNPPSFRVGGVVRGHLRCDVLALVPFIVHHSMCVPWRVDNDSNCDDLEQYSTFVEDIHGFIVKSTRLELIYDVCMVYPHGKRFPCITDCQWGVHTIEEFP